MSVQYQGVGAGWGCAPSRAKREAEGNLWVKIEQNIQYRQLLYQRTFYMYIVSMNGGYS